MRLIDSFIKPETVGNFRIVGIAQYRRAATDQNGHVINRQRKVIEHFLNLGVTL